MKSIFRERPDPVELNRRTAGWRGKLWVWLPVVFGLVVITIESTNTFSAANTNGWIRPVLERIFGHINDKLWGSVHYLIRKSGHFTGYGLLCLTLLRAWLLTLALKPALHGWRMRACALAVACTAFVASMDEWHQTFLPSRTGMVSDVVLDTVGGTAVCVMISAIFWRRRAKVALPRQGTEA